MLSRLQMPLILFVCFLIFFISLRLSPETPDRALLPSAQQIKAGQPASGIPAVFIHGWSGSEKSFQPMISSLTSDFAGPGKTMDIQVDPYGRLSVKGDWHKQKMPIIQITFQANHESMEQQALWLKNVFRYLRTSEGMRRMHVVTHSMGGKAFTCYLENIDHPAHYPVTEKFVAIATPFHWIQGRINESAYTTDQLKALNVLYQKRQAIPADIHVLAVAGVMQDTINGDGLVSLRGALFGRYFFNKDQYTEKIIYGPGAEHTKIIENPEVIRLIADYLWNIRPERK